VAAKSKRPCSKPGCPNLTTERFCVEHKKAESKRYDNERGTSTQRGYSYRWQKYRRHFLSKYPLCKHCETEGRVTPATDVDHIKAVSGPNDSLFWAPDNHESLCHACHSAKTMIESVRIKR
jgi:5-methylcytosine-specific restriction protein A